MAKTTETLNNVVFLFTNIQQPKTKYQSDKKEWSVQVVVSKLQAKEWNKRFKKQPAKVVDNDEFLEKFKMDNLPYPSQDEQYIIKLARDTEYKDGTSIESKYAPKVYERIDKQSVKDITSLKLVGNGSKGSAAYDVLSNDFGTFAKLHSICVEELIEYASNGSGSVFGSVVNTEETAPQQVDSSNKSSKVVETPTQQDETEESFDDECPF